MGLDPACGRGSPCPKLGDLLSIYGYLLECGGRWFNDENHWISGVAYFWTNPPVSDYVWKFHSGKLWVNLAKGILLVWIACGCLMGTILTPIIWISRGCFKPCHAVIPHFSSHETGKPNNSSTVLHYPNRP